MGDILARIWGVLESGYETLVTTRKGFMYMIEVVFESVSIPPIVRPYLPTFFGVAITTVVVIAVIKAIFGR